MIKIKKCVPDVYYKRSRDFQLLGRLYDIVLNYTKTSIDTIENYPLSKYSDDLFVDLIANTLGFKETRAYNVKQLKALCSVFMFAIRNKGNIQSIQLVADTIVNIEGINEKCLIEQNSDDLQQYDIFLPTELTDITLFEDVLNYILPAGVTCRIIRKKALEASAVTNMSDSIIINKVQKAAYETSQIAKINRDSALPKPSDLGPSRIDNITISAYNEELLKELVPEEESGEE